MTFFCWAPCMRLHSLSVIDFPRILSIKMQGPRVKIQSAFPSTSNAWIDGTGMLVLELTHFVVATSDRILRSTRAGMVIENRGNVMTHSVLSSNMSGIECLTPPGLPGGNGSLVFGNAPS